VGFPSCLYVSGLSFMSVCQWAFHYRLQCRQSTTRFHFWHLFFQKAEDGRQKLRHLMSRLPSDQSLWVSARQPRPLACRQYDKELNSVCTEEAVDILMLIRQDSTRHTKYILLQRSPLHLLFFLLQSQKRWTLFFQCWLAGDSRGPCRRPVARGHRVGYLCPRPTSHTK